MPQNHYNIYILDDDIEDVKLLEDAFKEAFSTSEVHSFTTTNQLLQQLFFLANEQVPDLILLDHRMPLLDGSNVVKHIRADVKLRGVALGIYSSDIQQAKLKDMFSSGIDFYIEKGNSYNEMKHHIKQFCEAIEEKQLNGGG